VSVWVPVIVAVVSAFGGGSLVALLLVKRQARKLTAETDLTRANATEILTKVAVSLVGPITDQLNAAKATVTELTADLATAQAELTELRTQVGTISKDLEAAQQENARLRGEN
jgi:peptidoglycan hydrolase CwlO-like protein